METAEVPGAAGTARRWELDALRGLMLVLMTLTHLPTRWSDPLGQPLGFVSAAEGFVFLSGYMAGQVYTRKHRREGGPEMRSAFLRRAARIWAVQAALLLFAFSVIAAIGVLAREDAITGMLNFYLERPLAAFAAGLLLLYGPPMLDILPMYVLFMLVSPLVLSFALRWGWGGPLAGSGLLWLAAQFGFAPGAYELVVALTGLAVPLRETGAFEIVAWQFLWLIGLWLGAQSALGVPLPPFPRTMVRVAWGLALTGLVWRHAVGQSPFGDDAVLNLLFDKWRLGPWRLLDFLALLLLVIHHGPWLLRHVPRQPALELLGRAALPVFCAHLVAALLALALFGAWRPERPWPIDVAIVATAFAGMFAVAAASDRLDRRAADLRRRLSERRSARPARRAPRGGPR